MRVVAAGKVSAISKLLEPSQITPSIIPCVTELALDSSQVRKARLGGLLRWR